MKIDRPAIKNTIAHAVFPSFCSNQENQRKIKNIKNKIPNVILLNYN